MLETVMTGIKNCARTKSAKSCFANIFLPYHCNELAIGWDQNPVKPCGLL